MNMADFEDDTYIDRLQDIRKEEDNLLDRLIAERKFLAENFKIDPLTGLYNKRILSKVRDFGTVIMFDVDDFKKVNDTFGHPGGDIALRAVGQAILNNIRVGDIGCRFGGDEFLIIFTTDIFEVIDARIKKIEMDANNLINIPGMHITLSVGVAFNEDKEKIDSMISKADAALYQSKNNGKNQTTYYKEGMVLNRKKEEN